MIFGKKYKITARKKEELEKELKRLETVERKNIADKLDWLREQINEDDDYTFDEVLDDKNFLEKRISEIKEVLASCEIVKDMKNVKEVVVGSKVTVGFEGFEQTYTIVSALEVDPAKSKISDESPVGSALIGSKVGDIVDVRIGAMVKKFRIVKIS